MTTLLPVDDNGNPIPALGFDYRGCHSVAVTNVSARNTAPIRAGVRIVSIVATGNCRFEVGGPGITADLATSPFLIEGQYVDLPLLPEQRYIAFVAEDDCEAHILGRL